MGLSEVNWGGGREEVVCEWGELIAGLCWLCPHAYSCWSKASHRLCG